jgi:hypothetical protein
MADKTHSNMLFANFNQDYTCISVGTRKGYSVTNCDPFGRVYTMSAYKSSECQFYRLWDLTCTPDRRRRAGYRRDALLHLAHCPCRSSGHTSFLTTETPNREHETTEHDLRAAVPERDSRCEAQPEEPGHRARNGDLHLRYQQYAATARYRDDAEP